MHNRFLPSGPLPGERHGGGEDAFPPLSRLHGAGSEGAPFAHVLDVVEDGDRRVACQYEIAVHAVHGEVAGNGALRGGETLCDYAAAVDAAGSGGVPEGTGVGEDVLGGSQ